MVALTITDTGVSASGAKETGVAQVAIVAGKLLFEDNANNNNMNLAAMGAAASAVVKGVALNNAAAGQPVEFAKPGSVITATNAPFTKGVPYALGASGAWVPIADVTATNYMTIVAVGLTTTTALFDPIVSGVQV